ncbi:MAG: helix-turn-helix domain-containing protein [Nanoarchaeota archaeon]
MPRLTDRKTLELIQTLYDRGMPIQAITEETGVSYATAYRHTRVLERGFASRMAYEDFIARQNGFSSYNAYQEYLVKKNGFTSRTDYETYLAEKNGFPTLLAYAEHLAVQNSYPSYNDYREEKARARQQRPLNREFGGLLQEKLKELGKSQAWLSAQIHRSKHQVCLYLQGKSLPNPDVAKEIFSILGVKNSRLEELISRA